MLFSDKEHVPVQRTVDRSATCCQRSTGADRKHRMSACCSKRCSLHVCRSTLVLDKTTKPLQTMWHVGRVAHTTPKSVACRPTTCVFRHPYQFPHTPGFRCFPPLSVLHTCHLGILCTVYRMLPLSSNQMTADIMKHCVRGMRRAVRQELHRLSMHKSLES